MDYHGYCIQETSEGFKVYSSYENWVQGREPLHVVGSVEEAQKWIDEKGLRGPWQEGKRTYTDTELAEIAKIFYETTGIKTATVFTQTGPLYGKWENLTPSQQSQTVEGLRSRIEREGLLGYIERKRPAVGNDLTDSIIRQLQARDFLPGHLGEKQYPYHGVAYGFRGEALETDDFQQQPGSNMLSQWAIAIARKMYGERGGWGPVLQMPVDKIEITGPDSYHRKWSRWDLFPD